MTSSSSVDFQFKILTLGDSGVGKTSIILRYTDNIFNKHSVTSTLGVDYKYRDIYHENKSFKLCLWDTAGQEKFNHLTKQYYKSADGVIFVFDLTNKESYKEIPTWFNELKGKVNIDKTGLVLVGNKCDAIEERKISKEEGEKLGNKLGLWYFEVSALTNDNIEKAFKFLLKDICVKKKFIRGKERNKGEKKIVLNGDKNENEQLSRCEC